MITLLKKINIFNWLGLYKPLIKRWSLEGLKIAKFESTVKCNDPVKYRIVATYYNEKVMKDINGYGEDDVKLFAVEKAIVELFEREQWHINRIGLNKQSTNGIAAHRFLKLAKEFSKNELVERDAFFRHWLTKVPFKPINFIKKRPQIKKFADEFDRMNHEFRIYETWLGLFPTVVAVAVNKSTKGFLIGSSANKNKLAAAQKACKEVFYSFLVENQDSSYDVNWKEPRLEDHKRYCYRYSHIPEWFDFDVSEYRNVPRFRPQNKIIYKIIEKFPIPVVCSYSEEYIDIWAGTVPEKYFGLICEQHGSNIKINCDYHPFP